MSDEKKTITIFSTKSIDEKERLFNKKMVTKHTEQEKYLREYFCRKADITKSVESMLESEDGRNGLKELLKGRVVQQKEDGKPLVDLKTEHDKGLNVSDEVLEGFLDYIIGKEIEQSQQDETKKDAVGQLVERVNQWGLKSVVMEKAHVGEEWEAVKEKSTMYQIDESDVYALHCLDNKDMDVDKNAWLPCLLNCAFALVGHPAYGVRIQLVMHDAEFGRDTEYAKHDVMVKKVELENNAENNAEVKKNEEFPGVGRLLGKNDECSILFFQHTVNVVTRILDTPEKNGDCVHMKVKEAMDMYGELKKIKEKSKNAKSLEECRAANEELYKIQDKLK